MTGFNKVDRRALVIATCLLGLGTVVRQAFAPGESRLSWAPAPVGRSHDTLPQIRSSVDSASRAEARASRPLAPGERIDLNAATAEDLRRLPSVGRARADAIIADRTSRGPFPSAASLARVPGIGPTLARRLEPLLAVPATASRAVPGASRTGIDLNRAQPNELEQITGIGPSLASRIVAARVRRGRFSSMDDLLKIPGIGPRTLEMLRNSAYVR